MYTSYVLGAYGIASVLLVGLVVMTYFGYQNAKEKLEILSDDASQQKTAL